MPHESPRFGTHPRPTDMHMLLVGGGPRSVIQVNADVASAAMYRSDFDELRSLGANHTVSTTIVESRHQLGVGAAFAREHTGMMNSGVEPEVSFSMTPDPSPVARTVLDLNSYRTRYQNRYGQQQEAYYHELLEENLPGAVMFKHSVGPQSCTPAGQLDQSTPFLMRRSVGEEEQDNFLKIADVVKKDLPFYHLNILRLTAVESISLKGRKPVAFVRQSGSVQLTGLDADVIRLNTGTTVTCPARDEAVRAHTFCQPMNGKDLRSFFGKRDMLDADGYLRAGTKIISGGLGLSGIDQVCALDRVMGLFEVCDSPLGMRVTEQAKHKYQKAIALVSRTVGKACMPKHSSSPEWGQNSPVLCSSKHLHALYLHKSGEEVQNIWFDIQKAAVARATNRTPAQTVPKWKNTQDLIASQFEENMTHLKHMEQAGLEELDGNMEEKKKCLAAATGTLYGAWRQTSLGTLFGLGLESDIRRAKDEMDKFAPLTWKGRMGWFHRAQTRSISSPAFVEHSSNKKLFNNFETLMSYVTASPVHMHSVFHLLVEAGIARVISTSYSEIHGTATGLELHGEEFDAFVVSPTFSRREDLATQSLTGQVEPTLDSEPSFGKVGKFRRFTRPDGTVAQVEDNGLTGKGFTIKKGKSKGTIVGAYACDLNNRASAVAIAASLAMRRMAASHLKAAGFEDPANVLDEIYNSQKPDEFAFAQETKKFKRYFEEACNIWAYLKGIEVLAGEDPVLFKELYDAGMKIEGRQYQIEKIQSGSSVELDRAGAVYAKSLKNCPVYAPASRDEYFDRFVDTTNEEDVAAYQEAFRLSKARLQERL